MFSDYCVFLLLFRKKAALKYRQHSGEKLRSKCMREHAETFSKNNSCNSSLASRQSSGSEDIEVVSSRSEKAYKTNRKSSLTHRGKINFLHVNCSYQYFFHLEPSLHQRSEISEIDMRLNALQEFMKRSLESAKNYARS